MSFLEMAVNHQKGNRNFSFDLKIDKGRYGITGPSGGGKTTLLNVIAGLEVPNSGYLEIDSKTMFSQDPKIIVLPEKRDIGYVFQNLRLFDHVDVKSNITYSWKFNPALEDINYYQKVVSTFELNSELEKFPRQLSGGQKQRVAIARALMMKPKLLLLDESFTNVDKIVRENIGDHLLSILDELSIPMIMVSHDIEDLEKYCQTIIPLYDGKIKFP